MKVCSTILLCIALLGVSFSSLSAEEFTAVSPDGNQKVCITVTDSSVHYRTFYKGESVVLESALDLEMNNHIWEMALGKRDLPKEKRWFDSLRLEGVEQTSRDTLWHNRFGERSTVKDSFNGLILHFVRNDKSNYRMDIEVRSYNEGVAFRYSLPMHPDAVYHRLVADNTQFRFPEGTMAWHQTWAQARHSFVPLENWSDDAERPLTLKLGESLYAAIGEAGVVDFPRGKLRLVAKNTLAVALNDNGTDLVTPYRMPWRVIMASDSPGGLLESCDIFLNLNEPSRIADDFWIRPGKIMRETRLTTENSKKVIDFCAAHGIDNMLYDWKWYGPSFDFASDATQVVAPIDMPEVIRYGKEKGVGVWLYVNQHALQKQGSELFPVYESWGIKGIKFGFVQFTSQHWADWVHSLVRDAAEHHLCVNIHDEYRPTGVSRTWPNLLTQEGICGNEEFPDATHNTILPFTRMLCGAADYTFCYFDPRLKTTHAHQLALPVIFFSPLQTLYWYDTPERIKEVPEMSFWDSLPTVWDETKVLDDSIGEHVVIARRSGDSWWIGAITSTEPSQLEISTDFLPSGKYVLTSYTDDPSAQTPTKVKVSRSTLKAGGKITVSLPSSGGAAFRIDPKSPERCAVYFKTAPASTPAGGIVIPPLKEAYPRMTVVQMPDKGRQAKVKRWVDCPQDLVDRLQMYWDSHATEVYIAGEHISHVGGPAAAVPTVRYSSSRSNLSDWKRPPLEQIKPRQDSSGLWMINRNTGECGFVDAAKTARAVESINCEILKIARDAAAMYRCGEGEKYAVLAKNVFDTYMTGLYYRKPPVDILHTHQQTLVGLTSFEVIHEDAVGPATECYDLLHDYLAASCSEKLTIYDEALRRWADVIIAGGVPHNNWNLLQAKFVLQIAMVLPDGERYLDEILNRDSIRQWSIGKLIDYGFDKNTGLWKECPNYSSMVIGEFLSFRDILLRATGLDLEKIYPVLAKARKSPGQYCFPNGWIAAWGDGYYQKLKDDPGNRTPVFYSGDVSWFTARSGENPDKSLMFSVAGSNGNHMHANGISLELYGKGYVLAPDMGKGAGYETNDHNEYYAQFPAHNTVCVDGVSTYATMQSHHAFKLESCYPDSSHKAFDSPVMFGDFSFTEPETGALQRRQIIMVNTPEGGYYVDIFRSRRSDGADKFHDYFFHAMGQTLELDVPLQPTEELSFAGAHLYAYSYLWDKSVGPATEAFTGKFTMTGKDGSTAGLKLWMNGERGRRVFKASAPVANSLTRTEIPYDASETPVPTMVVRQSGEAWNHPFIAVYEPFRDSDENIVESVSFEPGKITVTRTGGSSDVILTTPGGGLRIETAGQVFTNHKQK